jgi:hypothetical protein
MTNILPEQTPNLGYNWRLAVRNARGVINQVPLEAAFSYPVGAEGELRFFHYRVINKQIVRPFSRILAKLPKMTVVEVLLDKHCQLFPNLPEELGIYDVQWDKNLEKQMLNLLPSLMAKFPSQGAGIIGKHYLEAFEILTPKTLMPFYRSLNPVFFDWLEGE